MVYQSLATSIAGIYRSFSRNRELIWQLTKRDVIGRYRGSILGVGWSFLHPLLMLTVYTLVFSGVFKARWGTNSMETTVDFALILFAGMIVHGLFAECVNRAPTLILENASYVKKVQFPLEILAIVTLGSALFHAAVSFGILFIALALTGNSIHLTVALLPIVLLPLLALTIGIAWLFSSLGVFLRDVGHTVGVFTAIMMFCSPVFYPLSAIPEKYLFLMHFNPLAFFIEQTRDVMIWGRYPNWAVLLIWTTVSVAAAWGGFWWFQKTRRGFADVL